MLAEPVNSQRNDALEFKEGTSIEGKSHIESFPEGPWSAQELFLHGTRRGKS